MISCATEDDIAKVSIGVLLIMARIVDSYNKLKEVLIANNVQPYDIPTVEAFTIQVIARMKRGSVPEEMVFREVHKHFLS